MLRFLISKQTKKQLQSVSNFGKIKASIDSRLVGMADEVDSKSIGGNTVRVQVPQPADLKALENIDFSFIFKGFGVSRVKRVNVKQAFKGIMQHECNTENRHSSFLFNMSVVRYPVRCNHPAFRIKRIRLSINPQTVSWR